jgi:hypothetical protein
MLGNIKLTGTDGIKVTGTASIKITHQFFGDRYAGKHQGTRY